jgi:uncharacterized protein YebE (UPF0316 family)
MTEAGIFFLALLAGAVLDFTWAMCVESVQRQRAALAANLAVVLYVCTLFSTVLIVGEHVPAVIAYGLGNWIGTYIAVKRSHK